MCITFHLRQLEQDFGNQRSNDSGAYVTGTIDVSSFVIDPEDFQQRIQDQNINLNPQLVQRFLNASLNASEVSYIPRNECLCG